MRSGQFVSESKKKWVTYTKELIAQIIPLHEEANRDNLAYSSPARFMRITESCPRLGSKLCCQNTCHECVCVLTRNFSRKELMKCSLILHRFCYCFVMLLFPNFQQMNQSSGCRKKFEWIGDPNSSTRWSANVSTTQYRARRLNSNVQSRKTCRKLCSTRPEINWSCAATTQKQ